jgi:nitrite reductase/ring-hydroxylating ferredoxin subunit
MASSRLLSLLALCVLLPPFLGLRARAQCPGTLVPTTPAEDSLAPNSGRRLASLASGPGSGFSAQATDEQRAAFVLSQAFEAPLLTPVFAWEGAGSPQNSLPQFSSVDDAPSGAHVSLPALALDSQGASKQTEDAFFVLVDRKSASTYANRSLFYAGVEFRASMAALSVEMWRVQTVFDPSQNGWNVTLPDAEPLVSSARGSGAEYQPGASDDYNSSAAFGAPSRAEIVVPASALAMAAAEPANVSIGGQGGGVTLFETSAVFLVKVRVAPNGCRLSPGCSARYRLELAAVDSVAATRGGWLGCQSGLIDTGTFGANSESRGPLSPPIDNAEGATVVMDVPLDACSPRRRVDLPVGFPVDASSDRLEFALGQRNGARGDRFGWQDATPRMAVVLGNSSSDSAISGIPASVSLAEGRLVAPVPHATSAQAYGARIATLFGSSNGVPSATVSASPQVVSLLVSHCTAPPYPYPYPVNVTIPGGFDETSGAVSVNQSLCSENSTSLVFVQNVAPLAGIGGAGALGLWIAVDVPNTVFGGPSSGGGGGSPPPPTMHVEALTAQGVPVVSFANATSTARLGRVSVAIPLTSLASPVDALRVTLARRLLEHDAVALPVLHVQVWVSALNHSAATGECPHNGTQTLDGSVSGANTSLVFCPSATSAFQIPNPQAAEDVIVRIAGIADPAPPLLTSESVELQVRATLVDSDSSNPGQPLPQNLALSFGTLSAFQLSARIQLPTSTVGVLTRLSHILVEVANPHGFPVSATITVERRPLCAGGSTWTEYGTRTTTGS